MPQSCGICQGRSGRVIVVVGHGPSVLSGLGAVIDSCTVVRVKFGDKADPKHWGTRTDYLCGRSVRHADRLPQGAVFWHFNDYGWTDKWLEYFRSFRPTFSTEYGDIVAKPSHGLCAAFACMEYLKPKELAFIGCDRLLRPDEQTWKWNSGEQCFPHDWHAEHRALQGLGIQITDLVLSSQSSSISIPKRA